MDKQKEVCTNVPVGSRDAGRDFGFEAEPNVDTGSLSGSEAGGHGGEEVDASPGSENRPLCEGETGMRRIMSVMTAKNHEISVLIEKLNLEIR